jgi:hypothetical protein
MSAMQTILAFDLLSAFLAAVARLAMILTNAVFPFDGDPIAIPDPTRIKDFSVSATKYFSAATTILSNAPAQLLAPSKSRIAGAPHGHNPASSGFLTNAPATPAFFWTLSSST